MRNSMLAGIDSSLILVPLDSVIPGGTPNAADNAAFHDVFHVE